MRTVHFGAALMLCTQFLACEPSTIASSDELPLSRGTIDLDGLAAGTEGLFVGTVQAVQSRMSTSGDGSPPIPFTFVTFHVEESDDMATGSATLRFIGGAFPDGRRLVVSHIPVLEVGSRYLVHAAGNGQLACPVVGCERGLFRLEDGLVRGVDHRAMWQLGSGELRLFLTDEQEAPEAGAVKVAPGELFSLARNAVHEVRPAGLRSLVRLDPDEPFTFSYPALPEAAGANH